MPLVRFEVRNEYGLGDPELYKGAAKKEDPKALLDGLAVAGLVGILRQLGDLAEFAAEIFHDLHEQVTTTASRGHKMMARIRHIEEALPSIEKAVQAQTSYIHFAYIAGSDWHANLRTEHDHLLHSDLPRFIMDSYEECHDPPRLFLLDKFDSAGPGACLRRYSDPTYFKRAWASSGLMKAEKVQREKKTRKSKKKISRQRNGEVQHVTFLSRRTSSMQFTSPGTDGQSIAAETLSTSDMRLKSELGSRSTSFDSRTRFSYVETVPDINSSMEPEEPDYNELFTSKSKASHSDERASATPEEQNVENADDDSQHYPLQEQSALRSPSVTWDEKTEIVKPTSPQLCDNILLDSVQDSESLPVISEPTKQSSETTIPGAMHREDILFDTGNVQASFPGSIHFDEVASETDNYVDAQNTLESETETDSEFQTKREVKPKSNFNYQEMESGTGNMQDVGARSSDSSDVESPIASHTCLNEEVSPKFSNSVSSQSATSAQLLHMTDLSPSGCSVDKNDSENCNPDMSRTSAFESVNLDMSSRPNVPDLQTVLDNEITVADIYKSQESPKISDGPSIEFWTNGGLLGLEPSKPPDFSVPNIVCEKSLLDTNTNGRDLSSDKAAPKFHHDASSAKSDTPVVPNESISENSCSGGKKGALCISSFHQSNLHPAVLVCRTGKVVCPDDPSDFCRDEQHDDKSIMKDSQEFVPDLSKPGLDKFQGTHSSSIFAQSNGHDLTKANVASSGDELLVTSNDEVPSGECNTVDAGVSSSLSGLTRRLLANSFQRKASLTHIGTSTPSGMGDTDLMKLQHSSIPSDHKKGPGGVVSQASHEPNPREKLEASSSGNSSSSTPPYSLHSSPPLEHMKISFHPINGLETSKLKLEFPDRHLHESIEELMFPSFQLLPGPTIHLQNISSESDDDTFCRSCPYSSEDILSPRSDSNSELWAQDEGSDCENHEIHDNSCRVSSSITSVSSSLELEEMTHHSVNPAFNFGNLETENGIIIFQSGQLLDLPSLNSLKSSVTLREEKCDSGSNDPLDSTLQSPNELPPPPPPLPPLQWRIVNPSASVEHKYGSDEVKHSDGQQLLRSSAHQHPKQEVPKPPCIGESTGCRNKGMCDSQKLNGQRELNQTGNGKELDEREDLLHQIRSKKSFGLRRTVTSRPSLMPGPTTNVNVVAILEKANAIRQAFVGSDEGGDDENWSDG